MGGPRLEAILRPRSGPARAFAPVPAWRGRLPGRHLADAEDVIEPHDRCSYDELSLERDHRDAGGAPAAVNFFRSGNDFHAGAGTQSFGGAGPTGLPDPRYRASDFYAEH